MVWSKGRVRFYETQLYAQGIEGKYCHFIYLNKDEVVNKAPKQPTTPTKQTQTSIIKQAMTNATLLLTRVTPNDCEIRRGSGCSLWAPRLNPGLRRWLTKCLCLTRRGRWPDPPPSSCSLGWWRLRSAAGCGESQSHAERPVASADTRNQLLGPLIVTLLLMPLGRPSHRGSIATRVSCRTPSTTSCPTGRRINSRPMG
jgi:hypothetical protein